MTLADRTPLTRSHAARLALLLTASLVAAVGTALPSPADAGVLRPSCEAAFPPVAPARQADGRFAIASEANLVFLSLNTGVPAPAPASGQWRDQAFVQTADLDLDSCLFTPIGDSGAGEGAGWFTGSYDGQWNLIMDLFVDTDEDGAGLFGFVGNELGDVTITRVVLVDADVTTSGNNAGGLIGVIANDGSGSDVGDVVSASGVFGTVTSNVTAGGLVGIVEDPDATVAWSVSNSMVIGGTYAGGLVGASAGTIGESYARGTVSASLVTGGLLGVSEGLLLRTYSSAILNDAVLAGALVGATNSEGAVVTSFALGSDTVPDLVGDDPTGTTVDDVSRLLTRDEFGFAVFANTGWPIVDGWLPFDADGDPQRIWGFCDGVNDDYPFLLWQTPESERASLPDGCDLTVTPVDSPTVALTCTPDALRVGTTVTCTVTGADPGIDILWRAAHNPTFAEGVLRTATDGTGTFTFTVPAAALGDTVSVELVAWTSPLEIGVVEGAVPTAVPAGDGGPADVPLTALLTLAIATAGLGALGAIRARRARRTHPNR